MRWLDAVKRDPVPWLLDPGNASVRYLTLKHLFNKPPDMLRDEQTRVLDWAPVKSLMNRWDPINYWGRVHNPYFGGPAGNFGTLDLLQQLGAPATPEIRQACDNLLQMGRRADGAFAPEDRTGAPWLCYTAVGIQIMYHFGFEHDLRAQSSWDALVESILQKTDALDCPLSSEPCLDGLVKVLGALLCKPVDQRNLRDRQAIEIICARLLEYPYDLNNARNALLTLRFPRHTDTDLVELCRLLAQSPYNTHAQLQELVAKLLSQQDDGGRWWKRRATPILQEERIHQPSRWLTLEAVHTLALVFGDNPYAA